VSTDHFKRKLAAILSADVKDYSRLMGEDEIETVRTLTTYREAMFTLIQHHRGRVVDSPGDNVLSEFDSVVDAVQCAVEIQKDFQAKNAELPEDRRMEFRIGINLGDVIQDGERIYGDGVNIAARVEGLSEGGGICITRTVYNHVKNKLTLGYEHIGEHSVKNIAEPVWVYRVLIEPEDAGKVIGEKIAPTKQRWKLALAAVVFVIVGAIAVMFWNMYFRPPPIEPASVEKMAFPLPEKPSIAVLPFTNMSGDSEQEYIGDGISENIIIALSKTPNMFVIARYSAFTYKGKPVKVPRVSEDLGVKYVLEGSVQKFGERVRITAVLVDAIKGHQLWSEQYDRKLKDLFDLQDEITHKVVEALHVELTEGEQARVRHRSTNNLKAWGHAVKGHSFFERYTKEDNAKARELLREAVKLDPKYAWAWTWLSWTHLIDARNGWSESREESFKRAVEIAQKAMALDDTLPDVHTLQGGIYLYQGQHEKAIAEGKKAIDLGPNNATNYAQLAYYMYYAGEFNETIELMRKAMRLQPYYPSWYLVYLGGAYRDLGRYDEAIAAYKAMLHRRQKEGRNLFPPHYGLAVVYMYLGQEQEARAHAEELLRIAPNFSLERFRKSARIFWKDPVYIERALDALRRAGMK
jgi:adenylate cyclase